MDGQRFDRLTRAFATVSSRRGLLKGLAGGLAGALFGAGVDEAAAATRSCARKANGARCGECGVCRNGDCVVDPTFSCGGCEVCNARSLSCRPSDDRCPTCEKCDTDGSGGYACKKLNCRESQRCCNHRCIQKDRCCSDADCPACGRCDGGQCKRDPAKEGKRCGSGDCKACKNGECVNQADNATCFDSNGNCCEGVCCPAGKSCCDNVCCTNGLCIGGICCDFGAGFTAAGAEVCCPFGPPCGEGINARCCEEGEQCQGGVCCAASLACGDACCDQGEACCGDTCCLLGVCDESGTACCPLDRSCEDECCDADLVCTLDGCLCPNGSPRCPATGACCGTFEDCSVTGCCDDRVDLPCCLVVEPDGTCQGPCCSGGSEVCCFTFNETPEPDGGFLRNDVWCCPSDSSCYQNGCCPPGMPIQVGDPQNIEVTYCCPDPPPSPLRVREVCTLTVAAGRRS